ncbi:MAG TPA: hypothetical protein VIY69_07545 [Candidatus Acidoferrales bacterium]
MSEEMCPPKSRAWAALLVDRKSHKARQAAEAQMLWEIGQALRRGSLYVPHSLSYREKQVLFDTSGTTVRAPGSQRALPEVFEQLFANLEVGLEHFDGAVWFEHVKIDGTKIHQHPLASQEAPAELESIREELYANLPTVHLPELVMAMDSEIRFSWILCRSMVSRMRCSYWRMVRPCVVRTRRRSNSCMLTGLRQLGETPRTVRRMQ